MWLVLVESCYSWHCIYTECLHFQKETSFQEEVFFDMLRHVAKIHPIPAFSKIFSRSITITLKLVSCQIFDTSCYEIVVFVVLFHVPCCLAWFMKYSIVCNFPIFLFCKEIIRLFDKCVIRCLVLYSLSLTPTEIV